MSYEVSYLPQAEQDLIDILAYGIENWGEQLAESMYLKITDQLETLSSRQTVLRKREV